MLIACCAVAILMFGLAVAWLLKGFMVKPTVELANVDIIAFCNVLSLQDDRVLRERLSEVEYRRLRRARVRAIQGYVKAIAGNCAATVAILRRKAGDTTGPYHAEITSLVRDALRIRLLCLGFWLALWAESVLPSLEIRPMHVAGAYERLRCAAESCLRSGEAASPAV